MGYSVHLDQCDLVDKYHAKIPFEMKYDFVAMDIDSPTKLTDAKITSIVKTAVLGATYIDYGFGNSSDTRYAELKSQLKQLQEEKIHFVIYAHKSGNRQKNIDSVTSFHDYV